MFKIRDVYGSIYNFVGKLSQDIKPKLYAQYSSYSENKNTPDDAE